MALTIDAMRLSSRIKCVILNRPVNEPAATSVSRFALSDRYFRETRVLNTPLAISVSLFEDKSITSIRILGAPLVKVALVSRATLFEPRYSVCRVSPYSKRSLTGKKNQNGVQRSVVPWPQEDFHSPLKGPVPGLHANMDARPSFETQRGNKGRAGLYSEAF